MLTPRARVVLITGASQGIGLSSARALRGAGHRVYGASRSIRPGPSDDYCGLTLDVTSEESVERAVRQVVEREGRLDVLINSAGFALAGPIEETPLADAQAQFDTNLFGAVRACRAALPHFRRAGAGLIVNIGSLASSVPLPYQAYYSASKAALASFSEALRIEVARYGIRVVVVEPGDVTTTFTGNRKQLPSIGADYRASCERVLEVVRNDEQSALPPDRVAELVLRVVASRAPRPRYRVALVSQRAAAALGGLLPQGVFEWMLGKYYRV